MQWPTGGKKLVVVFVSDEEAEKAINTGKSTYDNGASHESKSINKHNGGYKVEETPPEESNLPKIIITGAKREECLSKLDLLFKKTLTEPQLYYLPLTKEEVREKQKKNEEGDHKKDKEQHEEKKKMEVD